MKKCSYCQNILEYKNFYKNKTTHSGYSQNCILCEKIVKNKYLKEYKQADIKNIKCSWCNKIKLVSEFNKNKRKSNGYNSSCKQCASLKNQIRYKKDKESIKQKTNTYYHLNKDKIQKTKNIYNLKREKEDINYKLTRRLRNRLYYALKKKSWKKDTHFSKYIGCSLEELKQHLQSQFIENMNWNNYGLWEIDHLIPLSSANSPEELYKLCHYTNLQPLWAKDNRIKSNNIK